MPQNGEDIFSVFDQEELNIRTAWKLWQLLTGHDPDSRSPDLTVLDECAPTFYRYCGWSLLTCVVLGVARLMDESKPPRGRDNVTLEAIWLATGFTGHEDGSRGDAAKSKARLKTTIGTVRFQKFRHRVVAHNDKATATGAEPADVPIQTIREAVKHLSSFRAHLQAARLGTVRSISTGEGRRADPADLASCRTELVALADRLKPTDMKGGER